MSGRSWNCWHYHAETMENDHEQVPDVAEDDNDEVAIRLAVELMIEEAMWR